MTRSNKRKHGFTLVELMVTVVMVAMILPVAVKGLTLINSLARTSSERAIALSLAESKLVEMLVDQEWLSGYAEGDFDDYEGMGKYQWTLTSTDSSSLKQLELTVKWTTRGIEKSLTLTTLVMPEES